MARDLGRFMTEAHEHVEEFKGELLDGGEDQDELESGSRLDEEDETRERAAGREVTGEEGGHLEEAHTQT